MKQVKYLIIGGGIAGTTAAEEVRKNDPKGSIVIISQEDYPLYSRIALQLYAKENIEKEKLILRNERFYQEHGIELLKGVDVVKVDSKKRVTALSNQDKIQFEKMLIATGGTPKNWNVPGGDHPNILRLQTLSDANDIRSQLSDIRYPKQPEAVIVGSGLVGLDLIKVLRRHRVNIKVLVRGDYYLSKCLGEEAGKLLGKILKEKGVEVIPNTEVVEVNKVSSKFELKTSSPITDYHSLITDLVCVGIGLDPNIDFLKGSRVKTNRGVIADKYLETSVKDIYAAGDVAEFEDTILGKTHIVGNWSNAAQQGKLAGFNMSVARKKPFRQIFSYSTGIFKNTLSFVGELSSRKVITRGSAKEGKVVELHIKNDKLIGAVSVNISDEIPVYTKLIETKRDLRSNLSRLSDLSYELSRRD